MRSHGRLFVADRSNSRIQVFNQDGQFLFAWRQFGRPSGVFIDKKEVIDVADSQSTDQGTVYGGDTNTLNFRRFVKK